MPSKRPLSRLRDIRDNALSIREYVGAMDESAFLSNKLIRDASERCLSRISEAAVKLGPVAEELLPGEDWRALRNLGNVLRHDYNNISLVTIWELISNRLEPLLDQVDQILTRYPEDQDDL
ncbi:HepT-like ribonuclease domain-containing protein [Ciceribacter selenitireducens]|uniref:HepT-like ribonuclease domain-containing protein n=1 Tax=Ciceribacter selenitireducens TaxID=448181 RepID=UPI0022B7478F|nr:HepT-like ribonuclease domain-containing protein [Ciceribacter selenitireducens]